jgi:hypothetical protein
VLSDGQFAVIGGETNTDDVDDDHRFMSSCEALKIATTGGDEQWQPLPPMHEKREGFACVAVAKCIIVAGGYGHKSA